MELVELTGVGTASGMAVLQSLVRSCTERERIEPLAEGAIGSSPDSRGFQDHGMEQGKCFRIDPSLAPSMARVVEPGRFRTYQFRPLQSRHFHFVQLVVPVAGEVGRV